MRPKKVSPERILLPAVCQWGDLDHLPGGRESQQQFSSELLAATALCKPQNPLDLTRNETVSG